ncbi:MAG: hypothetical protein IIC71_04630 [Acidobacteria bacterium]|nr:hypothetical protein [Acidobacteriota bacterium]
MRPFRISRSSRHLRSGGLRWKQWLGRGAAIVAVGAIVLPTPLLVADLISTGIYILAEGETQDEDVSIVAETVLVNGTVDGDLNVVASNVTITGTVRGDVLVASNGTVSVTGTIEGSIRGFASRFVLDGVVEGDVTVAAMSFLSRGTIERDLLVFGNSIELAGEVGRNVRGRVLSATVSGSVGRDIDISTDTMVVESTAKIAGDLTYRSPRDARISGAATIDGLVTPIQVGLSFPLSMYVAIATMVSWLGFIVGGIVTIYLFRSTTVRATVAAETHPFRSLGFGLITVLGGVSVGGALAITLVGIPVSIAIFALGVIALAFAPVPVLASVGSRALQRRGGVVGGFLFGAMALRLVLAFVPTLGVGLYIATVLMGIGAWVQGAWIQRSWGLPRPGGEIVIPRKTSGRSDASPPDSSGDSNDSDLLADDDGDSAFDSEDAPSDDVASEAPDS